MFIQVVTSSMKPMKIVNEEFERMKENLIGNGNQIRENLINAGYEKTGKLSKFSPFGWGTEVDLKREYSRGRFQVRMKNGKGRLDFDLFDPDKIVELPWHLLVDSYRLVKSSIGKGRKNYIKFEY